MELEKEALETADKVRESGLRFYLTGVGQAVINEAVEQTKDDGHAFNMYILAKSVIKVENHEGAVDDKKWTLEDAEKFYQVLSPRNTPGCRKQSWGCPLPLASSMRRLMRVFCIGANVAG